MDYGIFLQFGGLGIAALAIVLSYKHQANHEHETREVIQENTKSNQALVDLVQSVKDILIAKKL